MMSQAIRIFVAALVLIGMASWATADELRIKDLPIPEGATEITSMKQRGDIRFKVTSDFKTMGNFYAKQLGEQRWTKSGKDNLQQNFWVQTFAKDKMSLEVRVDSRGGSSEVRLTPTGLMWEEDDQPSPKNLPIPQDAKDTKFNDFFQSIEFKSSSNVKSVSDFLSKALVDRKWTKAATEFDLATFVRLKFTQGKSSLEIDIRGAGTGSEVAIRTKGMNWDGMKAEIKPAKIESPKVADGPARPEKPKKGIDKLPKLTSGAKVIVNGETIALPHVLAYEAVSAGEWVTRIVATDKPLNQESLIEKLKFPGENRDFDLPGAFLRLELDHKDRPDAINFAVQKFQTGAGRRNFKGEAIVEDGRARGSIQTKEPVEFGGRTITAEITFDVSLLTRDSKPGKQLSDAPKTETSEPDKPKKGIAKLPKLENSGKLLVNDKPVKLGNVVAYELMVSGKKKTAINFTDKPIPLPKLKALLAKDGSDMGLFDFDSQVKLEIEKEDKIDVILVAHDNNSFPIIGGSNVLSDVVIEDGRARGTVKLEEPKKFSGKSYSFDLTFDVEVLKLPATDKK